MIGSLGPKGSFSEFALISYLKKCNSDEQIIFYNSFKQIFSALHSNEVNKIFIPIENSIGGDVYSVLDELVHLNSSYQISAEVNYFIKQSLLAKKEISLDRIEKIYSHQQSFRQSSVFIDQFCNHAKLEYCDSNSEAAKKLSKDLNLNSASIGHSNLAGLYDLFVLDQDISNNKGNKTRFVLISSNKSKISNKDKSSLIFSTHKDQPGSLVEILYELANRNINLTRISSYPTKNILGEYLFFIDFFGHIKDELVNECLSLIEKKCSYFKFLGSYPQGETYA